MEIYNLQDKNIKGVIFDLDGTMVDSMWVWGRVDIDYLGKFGLEVPVGLQNDLEGLTYTETALYFKNRFNIPDSIETMMADWTNMAIEKYKYEVPVKPGLTDFIGRCQNKGIKLGIASSNAFELIESFLIERNLKQYFSGIISGTHDIKGKPAPDIYLAVADKIGVSPSECIVFEDIIPGIMAGKNAGMTVFAVDDLYSSYQENDKRNIADGYIYDYSQIII